ncbi:MGMT family protein [Kovacikia minuta CCNUW1]|uniref:MOSC domain-containing protein n=1 Tax=Kovacikia minuta TaxID=2931930 RepID=UPI001CCA982B|nr:MOSC domain-containing protein [Kovacikia minuta]UBF23845.1 MGMT family protein [Kovacikia minuta CCNUW1]
MIVVTLFLKAPPGSSVECPQLTLECGYGVAGDLSAAAGSPRQVLIVSQQTLREFDLAPGDLHENILMDAPTETLVSGQVIQIGEALIRPTFLCEPCSQLETIRKGLAKQIKGKRGVLGTVVRSGTIAVGDPMIQTSYRLPALAEDARGRFAEFVARIPPGKVVTMADLVLALGVTRAYYRVFPTWIKKAPADLPVHRIVAIDGSLLTRSIPDQAEQLAREGIALIAGKVDDHDRWQPENFHQGI